MLLFELSSSLLFVKLITILFVFQALDYVSQYKEYSLLWLTDQTEALSIFLDYGRDLSQDELDNRFEVDGDGNLILLKSSPKLSDFQSKVHK